MGKKVFYLNIAAVQAFRSSLEVQAVVMQAAEAVAAKASAMSGRDYSVIKTRVSGGRKTRFWAAVAPRGIVAVRSELRNNILIKALRSTKI